jgi:hypothetical protein
VFDNARDHLMLAASINIDNVLPESGKEKDGDAVAALEGNIDKAIAESNGRITDYDALSEPDSSAPPADHVSHWMQAGDALLGADFTWTAAFDLKFPDETEKAFNDSSHILRHSTTERPFPVDEWMYGVAKVRAKARAVENVLLLTENFGHSAPLLTAMQLPYKADDYWLALEYPQDYEFDGDRLLLSTIFAVAFDKTQPQAGLFLDEWVEVVPTRNETSGISFHYDAPNSEPPNACILAVTPELTGHWQWDDLMATLNETLDLAKKRAVEPQHIDDTKFAQFLPAVVVPTTRYLITLATNLLANVGMMQAVADVPLDDSNQ